MVLKNQAKNQMHGSNPYHGIGARGVLVFGKKSSTFILTGRRRCTYDRKRYVEVQEICIFTGTSCACARTSTVHGDDAVMKRCGWASRTISHIGSGEADSQKGSLV